MQQNSFYLLSALARGSWMIIPREAVSAGPILNKFLNKDFAAEDLLIQKEPIQSNIIAASGDKEYESLDSAPKGSVAIVGLKGTMLKYGTMCSYGTEEIAEYLYQVGSHKNIGSVVLDIDSGGGAVDSIAPVTKVIRQLQAMDKPIIASADLAASAAYWVASTCDKIVANNNVSAEFGSIGVMMSFTDVKEYYEKQGYKFHTIYAPESTHKNLPFEEALKGNYDAIKTQELSPLAVKFQQAVKNNRGEKLKTSTEGILNGKMFFAETAKEVGLIDEIGTIETAIEIAANMAEKKSVKLLMKEYVKPKN